MENKSQLMQRFELLTPESLQEALALLQENDGEARIISGGTALVPMVNQDLLADRFLVSLSRIPELADMEYDSRNGATIGSMVTLRKLERSQIIQEHYPTLASALSLVGNVRVRNRATLGGCLAHADPHMDVPPVLLGLGAKVEAASLQGSRQIPLAQFFEGYYQTNLRPMEIITNVMIPPPAPETYSAYQKFTGGAWNDWPVVGIAAFVTLNEVGSCQDVQVFVAAVESKPLQIDGLSEYVYGREPSTDIYRKIGEVAAEQVEPVSDFRGSAWYKRELVKALTNRALADAVPV